MAEVNFDEFKAVVDYITSNTGKISASLKALIDNTIAVRSDSSLSIITSNTSIKTVNIGAVTLDMETLNLSSVSGIKIEDNSFESIRLTRDGVVPDNALLSKNLSAQEIEAIAQKFISKTSASSLVKHYYASSVISFQDSEIPSMNSFFAEFYSINDVELDKPIVINSRDVNELNNVVTYAIGKTLSGAEKNVKSISTKTKILDSNVIFSDDTRTEIKTTVPTVVLNGSTTIEKATSNKSVMTVSMLPAYVLKKDLSNTESFIMQSPSENNPLNVATSVYFDEKLALKTPISQSSVEATKEIVNGLDYSFATSGFFATAGGNETGTINSIGIFNSLEKALLSDPVDGGGLGAASVFPEALHGSSSDGRDRAASIRVAFALLSAEIVNRFPESVMSGVEKLALSSQINLVVQDADTEFSIRPIVLSSAVEKTEVGTFSTFLTLIPTLLAKDRQKTMNWGYLG